MQEKKRISWGSVTLDAGRPKVCVPMMGADAQTMAQAARCAAERGAEILELRADSLSALPTREQVRAACLAVRSAAPEQALLLTLRTARDGGSGSDDAAAYESLLLGMMDDMLCDAVDVELSVGEEAFVRLTQAARRAGVCPVGSSHDFAGTPTLPEIVRRLEQMETLGAQVCKMAVMPHSTRDVLRLMEAAVTAQERLGVPQIVLAMGAQGVCTRVCAQTIGSCLTFGMVGCASAPGQMDAAVLRGMLEALDAAQG